MQTIKMIGMALLALIILPFYPVLKKVQGGLSEKMRIGEKVIVVLDDGKKKRVLRTPK